MNKLESEKISVLNPSFSNDVPFSSKSNSHSKGRTSFKNSVKYVGKLNYFSSMSMNRIPSFQFTVSNYDTGAGPEKQVPYSEYKLKHTTPDNMFQELFEPADSIVTASANSIADYDCSRGSLHIDLSSGRLPSIYSWDEENRKTQDIVLNRYMILPVLPPISECSMPSLQEPTEDNTVSVPYEIALIVNALYKKHEEELRCATPEKESFMQRSFKLTSRSKELGEKIINYYYSKPELEIFINKKSTDVIFGILVYILSKFDKPIFEASDNTVNCSNHITVGPQQRPSANEIENIVFNKMIKHVTSATSKEEHSQYKARRQLEIDELSKRSQNSKSMKKSVVGGARNTLTIGNLSAPLESVAQKRSTRSDPMLHKPSCQIVESKTSKKLSGYKVKESTYTFDAKKLSNLYFACQHIPWEEEIKKQNIFFKHVFSDLQLIENASERNTFRFIMRNMISMIRRYTYTALARHRAVNREGTQMCNKRAMPNIMVPVVKRMATLLAPLLIQLKHKTHFKRGSDVKLMENMFNIPLDKIWFTNQSLETIDYIPGKVACHQGCPCQFAKNKLVIK